MAVDRLIFNCFFASSWYTEEALKKSPIGTRIRSVAGNAGIMLSIPKENSVARSIAVANLNHINHCSILIRINLLLLFRAVKYFFCLCVLTAYCSNMQ